MRGIAPITRLMMNGCIYYTHNSLLATRPSSICQMKMAIAGKHVKWKGNRLKMSRSESKKRSIKQAINEMCLCAHFVDLAKKQLHCHGK